VDLLEGKGRSGVFSGWSPNDLRIWTSGLRAAHCTHGAAQTAEYI